MISLRMLYITWYSDSTFSSCSWGSIENVGVDAEGVLSRRTTGRESPAPSSFTPILASGVDSLRRLVEAGSIDNLVTLQQGRCLRVFTTFIQLVK